MTYLDPNAGERRENGFSLNADVAGRGGMATGLFDAATVDDKFTTDSIGEDRLTANELTGRTVGNVAAGNLIGGIPLIFMINVPAGATGNIDEVMTHKVRVINAWLVKTNANGGGTGTIQVSNGATAITDAMSINVNDQTITRAALINDASHEIAAAGTLRIVRTRTASTDETCIVYIEAVRVP